MSAKHVEKKSQLEFIILMASLMSLVALSIDALLPALEQIGFSIGIQDSTDNQLLTTMIFLGLQFFSLGFAFGNTRALAMQPIGHIAGIGSAINGFVSTIMAVPIATSIGSFVKDTAQPLFGGFLVCGICAILLLLVLKR